MRERRGWIRVAAAAAMALCAGASCGGSSTTPAQATTGPVQATPPAKAARPVPPALAFAPAAATILARFDVAAFRETPGWPVLRQQLAPVSAELPACDIGLLEGIDELLVAVASDESSAAGRSLFLVKGDVRRAELVACVTSLSRALGGFDVRETKDGFYLLDATGGELAAAVWTRDGVDVAIGGLTRGGGPSPNLQPLLDEIRLDSALWWVSSTDEVVTAQPLPSGNERFEALWFEARGEDGGLVFRCGMRFATEEGAAEAPKALMDGLMKGIRSRGAADLVDRAGLERRLRFQQNGRWVLLDAQWSESELAAYLSAWQTPAE